VSLFRTVLVPCPHFLLVLHLLSIRVVVARHGCTFWIALGISFCQDCVLGI
jgi:hypothetical protein